MSIYLTAYPNIDGIFVNTNSRDTEKWLETIKNIYRLSNEGVDKNTALKQLTANWNQSEITDFLNWVKFYEQGSHLKYKFANIWLDQSSPGYFLQVKKQDSQDINNVDESKNLDKKLIIEKQRSKIISRLDSAEKLLRSRDGQILAGKELETLMEAIYQLKKKIQLVNKITVANKTYQDLIIREANILNKKGFENASNVLHKIAQELPAPAEPTLPTIGNGGAPGGMPSMGPGMPQTSLENSPNNPPSFSKGINDFLKRMNSANLTEDAENEDSLNIEDGIAEQDTNNSEDALFVSENELVSEAQAQPEKQPNITDPGPIANNSEVSNKQTTDADNVASENKIVLNSDFDSKLEQLMKNVTVADVIIELESLSKIFKTREIPRRLARADMMLDSLGLAPFFPSLSEAQNKSLEANNYIATRIDDILAKLSGSITTNDIDLQGNNSVHPQVENLKNKLENDEEKEKQRKEMRKQQEAAEIESKNKPTPEIQVSEDMAEPVNTATPAPQAV